MSYVCGKNVMNFITFTLSIVRMMFVMLVYFEHL